MLIVWDMYKYLIYKLHWHYDTLHPKAKFTKIFRKKVKTLSAILKWKYNNTDTFCQAE